MKKGDQVAVNRRSYNRIAKVYDYEHGASEDLGNEILKIKVGGVVLDLGCGPGNNFPFLLSRKPKKIVAVDFSKKMLSIAKERFRLDKRISYILSTFQDFDTNLRFDFILANLSFVHIPKDELVGILKKIKELLKKDGFFFANYFEGPDETRLLTSDWEEVKKVKRFFSFYKVKTLKNIYNKAGLKVYKIAKKHRKRFSFTRINIFATR